MDGNTGQPRVMATFGQMVIISGIERMSFEVLRTLRERGAAVQCVVNRWESTRVVDLAEVALQLLLRRAVPAVAAVVAGRIVLAIAEVLGQFGVHRTFQQRFGELLQQPVLANDLLRILVVRKQLLDQFRRDVKRGRFAPSARRDIVTIGAKLVEGGSRCVPTSGEN
jgi:hypothetical protein